MQSIQLVWALMCFSNACFPIVINVSDQSQLFEEALKRITRLLQKFSFHLHAFVFWIRKYTLLGWKGSPYKVHSSNMANMAVFLHCGHQAGQ